MAAKITIKFRKGDKKFFKKILDIANRNNADIIMADDSTEYNILTFYIEDKTDSIYFKSNIGILPNVEIIKEN